jgi:PAS domain S-box-containing protein
MKDEGENNQQVMVEPLSPHENALHRANRAYKTISACNQAVIRARTETELLHNICRTIVEQGGYRMAWVGFAEDDAAKIVRPVAQAGYEAGYLEKLNITWDDSEQGRGPTGVAIRTGKTTECRNMLTDPQFAPWRKHALERGYRSSLVIPLIAGERVFGAVNIYAAQPDAFDSQEVKLLAELAENMSYGIMALRLRSERQEVLEALQESERQYKLLVHNIPAIVFKGYKDWHVDFFDDKIQELTGYSREVFNSRQMKWSDLIIREDLPWARKAFVQGLKGNRSCLREYRITHKTGRILWLQSREQIICDSHGHVDFISGVFFDITQQKETETALQNERDFIAALLDTVGALVMVLDRKGRIIRFNQACEKITGYSFQEVKNRPFWEIFLVPEEIEAVKKVFKKLKTTAMPSTYENYWRNKDGSRRMIAWSNTTLCNRDNTVAYIIASGIDITEEQRLRRESEYRLQQVIQKNKLAALGEVVAGVAHEINNPNSFITYNIPILEETWQLFEPIIRDYGKDHPQWRQGNLSLDELCQDMQEIITALKTGSERINRVVSNLKDFAQLDDSIYTQSLQVNELIAKTLTIVGGQIRKSAAGIEVSLSPDIPQINGHLHKLEQVVANLLLNAAHAITNKEHGKISITARFLKRLEAVLIEIEDNGQGMDREVMNRIFEPFFTTRRAAGGTGLGLSVSYGLIQEHHGNIGILSRPGKGSRFTIYLPTAKHIKLDLRPSLLCVTDDAQLIELLKAGLLRVEEPVDSLDNAERVLAYLEMHPEVDIVICDPKATEMNVWELLVKIKERFPLLTVIICAEEQAVFPEKTVDIHAPDYWLGNPFTKTQLMEIINNISRQKL